MSELFNRTLKDLKRKKETRDSGGYNCIPFPFKRLSAFMPGIIKGVQYIVTASSGIGKTKLTKFLFVYNAYKFIKEHPESGITLKIHYFALEESKEEFMYSMFSHYLYEIYGFEYSSSELQSMDHGHEMLVTEELLLKIEESKEFFSELDTTLEIIDHVHNPTGAYKICREYAFEVGKFYKYKRDENGKKLKELSCVETVKDLSKGWDEYEENDENHYVINIVDHLSLFNSEQGFSLHETMTLWSARYARKGLTKKMKQIVVSVQQQASDKEKLQYNLRGDSIETKLEPSLDGLGDNKLTQRDALVVIGLFNPARYGIVKHEGYDILKLQECYCSMSVLKNRIGKSNLKVPLFFHGQVDVFQEYPKLNEAESLKKAYQTALRINSRDFKRL
jgi:hypothetical protein